MSQEVRVPPVRYTSTFLCHRNGLPQDLPPLRAMAGRARCYEWRQTATAPIKKMHETHF